MTILSSSSSLVSDSNRRTYANVDTNAVCRRFERFDGYVPVLIEKQLELMNKFDCLD